MKLASADASSTENLPDRKSSTREETKRDLRPTSHASGSVVDRGFIRSANVDALRRQFEQATPFPHLLFQGLFTAEHLDAIGGDFSEIGFGDWLRFDTTDEVKRASRPGAKLGSASQRYVDTVHRGDFIRFLSDATGIEGLLPDPSLFGGGLHEIPDGGRFSLHTDFNKHPVTGLDTRLVLITYLNRDWQPSYGGSLELWDQDTDTCAREIVPLFGTTILFAHTANSLHGHPCPVSAPKGRSRRSIATYYYSNGRPEAGACDGQHTTRMHRPVVLGRWARAATAAKYFVPPVIVDGATSLRRLSRR